ncbi:hypothetical protein Tco_1264924 [Tanacetum coccineum]
MKTPMSSDTKLTKDEKCESVDSTKYTLEGQMLIEFVIQNKFFSFTIEEFGQILSIPTNGACSFTDKWSLDNLQYSVPTSGPYQTNPHCLDEIKNYVQEELEGPATRIHHKNCTFVGCCLTSWFSKKQTALVISTTEAEYVSARKACQQALWMKQALIDYDVRLDNVPIMCDNKGEIDLSKNPMQHS